MKKKHDEKSPKVHPQLKGFDITINEFGELVRTHSPEELNKFLNKKVVDKKLKDRFGYKSSEDDETPEQLW